MGDWRTEQREDAVTRGLRDVSAVAADRDDHQLECRVDDASRFLRVVVLFEFGRALDVGVQRGDRLALAVVIFRGRRLGDLNRCTA